jgi:hypothetical protein
MEAEVRPQYHSPRRWKCRVTMDTPESLPLHWRCGACGHIWETVTAILPRALGCPECGGKAECVEEGT